MSIHTLHGLTFAAGIPSEVREASEFAAERMAESGDALLDVLGTFGTMAEAFASQDGDRDLRPTFYGGWVYGPDYTLPDADGDEAGDRRRVNRSAGYAFRIGEYLNATGRDSLPAAVTARIDGEWKRPGLFCSCFLKACKAAGLEPSDIRHEVAKFEAIPAGSQSSRAIYSRLASIDEKSAKPWAKAFARTMLAETDARPVTPSTLWRMLLAFASDTGQSDKAAEYFAESEDLPLSDVEQVEALLDLLAVATANNRKRMEAQNLDADDLIG